MAPITVFFALSLKRSVTSLAANVLRAHSTLATRTGPTQVAQMMIKVGSSAPFVVQKLVRAARKQAPIRNAKVADGRIALLDTSHHRASKEATRMRAHLAPREHSAPVAPLRVRFVTRARMPTQQDRLRALHALTVLTRSTQVALNAPRAIRAATRTPKPQLAAHV